MQAANAIKTAGTKLAASLDGTMGGRGGWNFKGNLGAWVIGGTASAYPIWGVRGSATGENFTTGEEFAV